MEKQHCYNFGRIKLRIFLLVISAATYINLFGQYAWYTDYDVKYYKIDIQSSDTSTFIAGNTTILAEIKNATLDSFRFELNSNVVIDSIKYIDKKLSFKRGGAITSIPVSHLSLGTGNFSIVVYYHGTLNSSGFLSSFSNKTDNSWNIPVTWSLSEPFGAKVWFPCKQDLPDKADSVAVFLTVPKHLKAGSNGILTKIASIDEEHHRYEWKSKYPTAYYLISLAIADYSEYSYYVKLSQSDSVFFQNYLYNRPGYLEANKSAIDETADFLRLFSQKLGEYPFKDEKYGHCVAPLGGGMEHQTMTTLSSFGFALVAHELAHQWFGDLITCATWQDIWINEGFASYGEYLAIDSLRSHAEAIDWLKSAHTLAMSNPGFSVFIPVDEVFSESRIFNYSITYRKGAAIIHMLRYEINNDAIFFQILKKFLTDFKFRNATGTDFLNTVNTLTGKDYTWFFDQWYFGKGHPEYDFSWKQSGDTLYITSLQTHSNPPGSVFKMHFDVKFEFSGGDTTIRLYQDQFEMIFTTIVNKKITGITINPESTSLMKIINVNKVPDIPSIDDNVKVAPNPFDDYLNISFQSPPRTAQSIKLVSLNGSIMEILKNSKRSEIKLDTKDCEPGVYLLYVANKSKTYIRKVIKLE
jgi:aminopeptidase N